ncbi:MAG TPA: transporter substrate-binding domain-containing protein [Chthoniobacterales bacterium]
MVKRSTPPLRPSNRFVTARGFLAPLALACLVLASGRAEEPEDALSPAPTPALPRQELRVGVFPEPPFDILQADGSWTGLSVELWQQIATELGLTYAWQRTDRDGRFAGLTQGWLDVSVGPLTITARREQICDFTHAYFSTGLGMAVLAKKPLEGILGLGILQWSLWRSVAKIVLGLLAALTVVACLVWICERRGNAEQFGHGNTWRGLGAAMWWAAVTMTTVGYGDLAPRTPRGRLVAILWMFTSLILVSTFTATMASILTAERLSGTIVIHGPEDLRRLRVGALATGPSQEYLRTNHVSFEPLLVDALFEALHQRKVDVIVLDEVLLRYQVRTRHPGEFTVLPLRLDSELYAFALREGSPLREAINRVMLRKIHEQPWKDSLFHYLGSEGVEP